MSQYLYLIDTNNRGDLIEEVLKRRTKLKQIKKSWTAIQENKWNLIWKTTVNFTPNYKGPNMDKIRPFLADDKVNLFDLITVNKKPELKIINHFPNPEVITKKTELVRSLNYKKDFLPETYILNFNDGPNEFLKNYTPESIWILKPEYLHSGKGIQMFDNLKDIVSYFESAISEIKSLENKTPEWVIQKYINNPFLIDGRKFDIRINVLVTKDLDIYVNPHGFIRIVSDKYVPYLSGDYEKDRLIHITNHSVQKHGKNYGLKEEGNVMSLLQFQTYLNLTYGKNVINVYRDFFPQWNRIIKTVINSNPKGLKVVSHDLPDNINYFEMFGFDFIIDEFGKSWLLEVNTNPGLEQDNSWAIHIVRNMLESLAEICIDPLIKDLSSNKSLDLDKKLQLESLAYLPPKNLKWEHEIKKQTLPKDFKIDRFYCDGRMCMLLPKINEKEFLDNVWNKI